MNSEKCSVICLFVVENNRKKKKLVKRLQIGFMNLKENKDVVLNYIDKTHISLHLIGRKLNKTMSMMFIVCSLILLIKFEVIKMTGTLSLSGLSFQISSSFLIIALCILAYFLQAYFLGLGVKESENSDTLVKLYKKLGYYDETLNSEDACLIEYPTYIVIAFAKRVKKNKKIIGGVNDFGLVVSTILLLFMTPVVIGIITYNSWFENSITNEFVTYFIIFTLSLINLISGIVKANTL